MSVEPIIVLDTDTDEVESDVVVDESLDEVPLRDSMTNPEDHLQELYAKASELGIDEMDLLRMSEDEVAALLAEKGEEETTGEEETAGPQPQPTAETPAAPEPAPQSLPAVNWEERYKGMTELKVRQDAELSQLRGIAQQVAQVKPYIDALNDPRFRQHVDAFFIPGSEKATQSTEEYDPLDPASVERHMEKVLEKKLAQREATARSQAVAHAQQSLVGNFNNGLIQARARLIAEGNDPAEVDAVITEFSQKVTRGDFVSDALRLKRVDNMIAEAEMRGRKAGEEEALKKFKGASSHPIRTASAAGRSSTPPKKTAPSDLSEVSTAQEMDAFINTLEIGTPAWEKAMRYAVKNKWA